MAEQVPANSPGRTTLAANALATDFALTITSAAGFGTTGNRRAMLWTEDGSGNILAYEYVIVSGRSGTTLNILAGGRGVEGTTAQAWTAATPTYIAEVLTNAALVALLSEAVAPKMANPMTTTGDMIRATGSGVPVRVAIGTAGQVMTVVSGQPAWAAAAGGGMANPMTTPADLIVGGAAGAPARLAKGADGQVLTVDPGTHLLVWANSPSGFADPLTTKGDLIARGASSTARLAVGSNGQVLTADSAQVTGLGWTTPAAGGGGGGGGAAAAYVLIQDQRASGTNGGTYSPGNAWQTRPLQTEVVDTGGLASVASNQITLAAGTYIVEARAAFQFTGPSRLRLRDVTNNVTLVLGLSSGDNTGDGGYTAAVHLPLSGRFTLAAPATLELQMYARDARTTFGFGAAVSSGDVEVYASVELWKEGGGGGSSFGQVSPTDPTLQTWAWTNQGSSPAASVDSTIAATIFLHSATPGSSHSVRMRRKAIPATPYVVTFGFIPHLWTDFNQCGVVLRESSSGKFIFYRLIINSGLLLAPGKFTNETSFVSDYLSVNLFALPVGPLVWFHVQDDGTNRKLLISHDGVFAHAEPFNSVGRTDFCTPDQIGFAVNPFNGSFGAGMLLVSYAEA